MHVYLIHENHMEITQFAMIHRLHCTVLLMIMNLHGDEQLFVSSMSQSYFGNVRSLARLEFLLQECNCSTFVAIW